MTVRFSILVPVYNTPLDLLRDCLESVVQQTSDSWELCVIDDCSPDQKVRDLLETYSARFTRIRVKEREINGGIVAASNDALSMAQGEFVLLLDHDDLLEPDAIEVIEDYLSRFPESDFLYSDEYHLHPDGTRTEFVKPEWSPERLRSQMYVGHLVVIRTSVAKAVGGFRAGFEGSQDHDFVLRVSENARQIVHIPESLYHWRVSDNSFSHSSTSRRQSFEAGQRAVEEHLKRVGIDGSVEQTSEPGVYRVRRSLRESPLVSIVIPTRGTSTYVWGRYECLIVECIRELMARSTYRNFEIVVVADEATPSKVIEEIRSTAGSSLVLVNYQRPFNFSDKVNQGVAASTGQVVLLLNDDTRIVNDDWCEPMLELCQQTEVGMVGNLLLFGNSRIQHAGHRYVDGAPTHVGFGAPISEGGPAALYRVQREVSGVTAACAMLRREVFDEVGGLSNRLPNNFNDVDLNQKIRHLAYRIVWTPYSKMYHFESASRAAEVADFELEELDLRWFRQMRNDQHDAPIPHHLEGFKKSSDRRLSHFSSDSSLGRV